MVYLPSGHGGYIPFVELPCERYLGETLQWILTLALSPLTCPLVPWLCCPFEIEDTSITISNRQECNTPGAAYGSTAFWTMQGVSIIGLVFAMASLANCAAGLAGIPLGLPGGVLPLTLELPDLRMALSGIEVDKVNEEGQLNVIKKRVIDILKEKYKQELEKKRRMDTILMKEEMEENKKKEEVDSSILPEYDNATLGHDLSHSRKKREVVPNLRIPTLLGHVPGPDDQRVDPCERDEILAEDGDCYEVLSQGPCEDNDILLMDPYTRKGFCGPRLCAPDRVFVFSDQQCHDPREYGICPP